jgi:hypothetical protein
MACRLDIKKTILDDINTVFIEGRYTYYRLNDDTFRVANAQETKGKSRAKSLNQAREIAIEVRNRIIDRYGNNVMVEIIMPEYVGFPVELKVTPTDLYIEKLYSQVAPTKRTEYVSRLSFLQDPALFQQELIEDQPLRMIPYEAWAAQNRTVNPIIDEKGNPMFNPSLSENNLVNPALDKRGQFKLFQVKTIFNSVEELNTKLKSINRTIAALGSDKNIDDVLKKAGLEPDLRNQFIKLVKENPQLKPLKVGEVLSFYLKQFEKDTNDQYYKAILEPINTGLEDLLIKYFDRFNISRVELDNLKEKFGVDSTGVFDVLNKTVYYGKNRNLLTLPEEYGHVFVELLGAVPGKKTQNPLFQYLYENIESWDGYQRVFEDYKNLYVNDFGNPDIYRIKKEAIGQAIGLALVRNFKDIGVTEESKTFWSKIKEAIDYILDLIKGVDYVSLNTAADSIARDILNNNYKKLDRLLKDTSNYNLLSYSETIKLQNQKDGGRALNFMKWFSDKGMIITGSLSYRLQGETFRPEIDALHDIDNVVPADVHGLPMAANLLIEKIRQAVDPTVTGTMLRINAEKLAEQVPVLVELKEQFPNTEYLYAFSSSKLDSYFITINAIWSKSEDLKNRFKSYSGSFNDRLANFTEEELGQLYLFDFFLSPRSTSDYITIEDRDFGLTLNHFAESFVEKQGSMGRPKDAFDYQKWKPFKGTIPAPLDLKSRLSYFQLTPTIKPGVPELFESNPELANAVYEALGFGKKIDSNISIKELEDTDISKEIDILYKGESIGKATLVKSENSDDVDYIEDWSIKGEYQNKGLGYSARQILQNKYPTLKLSSAATDKSKYLYEEVIKNQITPQQKQQAQQLYSQYLDGIFPDSKVKDIVYHGTDFSKDLIDFKTDRGGIFLASTPIYASYFSKEENAYPALVDFKNSYQAKQLTDNIGKEEVNQIKLKGYDSVVGKGGISKMKQHQNDLEFIAFSSKQVHILGTQKDIEGFKTFVQTTTAPELPPITEIPDVMASILYQNNNCK